jgi:hypothetical protein
MSLEVFGNRRPVWNGLYPYFDVLFEQTYVAEKCWMIANYEDWVLPVYDSLLLNAIMAFRSLPEEDRPNEYKEILQIIDGHVKDMPEWGQGSYSLPEGNGFGSGVTLGQ